MYKTNNISIIDIIKQVLQEKILRKPDFSLQVIHVTLDVYCI
jgi:hypothetical protein